MAAEEHWLWRLDADQWLRAAQGELAACEAHVASRRTAVTHARRAAGMAVNAVLVATRTTHELRWGRSYLEHLQALAGSDGDGVSPLPAGVQALATRLLAIAPVASAGLVALGRGPHAAADDALAAARELVERCAEVVARSSRAGA